MLSCRGDLLASIAQARDLNQNTSISKETREVAVAHITRLTKRQRQILDLGLSQRTVDNHRAAIMKKTGSASLPALIRTALAAA